MVGVALVAIGCSSASQQTLDDVASLFHDDVRWGRLPAAETVVTASLRTAFDHHHEGWGTRVRIMDMEVEGIRTALGTGTIRVQVQWTLGEDSTDLRQSLIEEDWVNQGGAWQLHGESVVVGDADIFTQPQ